LNENLPWRTGNDDKEKIERIKRHCLANPEKELLTNNCNQKEMLDIFYYLKSSKYSDRPNYEFIRNILQRQLNCEIMKLSISQEKTFASSTNHTSIEGLQNDFKINQVDVNQVLLCNMVHFYQNIINLKREINENILMTMLSAFNNTNILKGLIPTIETITENNVLTKKRVRVPESNEEQNEIVTNKRMKSIIENNKKKKYISSN